MENIVFKKRSFYTFQKCIISTNKNSQRIKICTLNLLPLLHVDDYGEKQIDDFVYR